MSGFASPDDAVRAYWRERARIETARSVDPFAMNGLAPVEDCRRCGGQKHGEREAKGGGWVDRCSRCGTPWVFLPVNIVRGTIQVSRVTGATEAHLIRWTDLARLVEEIPPTDALIYGLVIVSNLSEIDVGELAAEISAADPCRWPPPPAGFTRKAIRYAVGRARRRLEAHLDAAGMLGKATS